MSSDLERISGLQTVLIDINAVAAILACSPRHVRRLAEDGRIPPPIKLGQLVRWRSRDIHDWLTSKDALPTPGES